MTKEVEDILFGTDLKKKRALFAFDQNDSDEIIRKKFNLWAKSLFTQYFTSKDAGFHKELDLNNIRAYKGDIDSFTDIVFRGGAKRQPLDAKILTPRGWTTMGELKLGDKVIGRDGKPTKIEYLSPIIDRPIYKIETEDGRKTECDSEHLWTVRKMSNAKEKNVTIDVQKMLDDGFYYDRIDKRNKKKFKEYKYAIDTVGPVDFEEKDLIIDPYLLGILLGDGSFEKKYGSAKLTCHKDDLDNYLSNIKTTKYNIGNIWDDKRNPNVVTFSIIGIAPEIRKLRLNVHGRDKFIPDEYLFGSIKQRMAILEGLMDTDGTLSGFNHGSSSFSSTSVKLINGVVDLVRSLGGRATKTFYKNKYNGYYKVNILFNDYKPFRLNRKKEKCGYASHTFSRIKSIELVGNKKGRCIKISNNNGLYVTDDYLLTHNTARTKLFIAFAIANDISHFRKYIKVLAFDTQNSKQITTDIYNMFAQPKVQELYQELFQKSHLKREETMGGFTTSTGIKLVAGTVGTDQRGALQDEARPDLIWYEDFENRKTLRSAVITKAIWDNMEEARTSLAKDGSSIYTCNYISEAGNVHKLVEKKTKKNILMIVPIIKDKIIAWERYTEGDIQGMRDTDDDFEGERLCLKPNTLIKTINGFKRIDSLKVGDMVLTHLGNYKKILTVFKSNRKDLLDITINNKKLTITKNHPVLVSRKNKTMWVEAGKLKINDLIII